MDMSGNEKKISSPKKETKNLKETKTKIEEKNQSETHPLDDGEVINPDLIKEGAQVVEKQGVCYESMDDDITNGLISLLEKLLQNPIFRNKIEELLGITQESNKNGKNKEKTEERSLFGKLFDKILNFFKGNNKKLKEKDKQLAEANTIINNQNIEVAKLKTRNESLESENKFLRTQVSSNPELIKIIEKLVDKLLEIPAIQEKQNDKALKDVQEEQAAITNMTN